MRPTALALMVTAASLLACSQPREPASAPALAAEPPDAPVPPADPATDPALGTAIATVLGDDAASTRMAVKFAGEGDGRVALAYLVGMNWCGSGGCNLLILRQTRTGWEPVGNVSRVRPPVRVLSTSTHGLPDLGVTVSGGGGPPAYEAKVAFDGRSYPRFPSDEPLVGAEGGVVITDADIPPPSP